MGLLGLTAVMAMPLPADTRWQQAIAHMERALDQYAAQAK
jgi:uncharacterized membrane protein